LSRRKNNALSVKISALIELSWLCFLGTLRLILRLYVSTVAEFFAVYSQRLVSLTLQSYEAHTRARQLVRSIAGGDKGVGEPSCADVFNI